MTTYYNNVYINETSTVCGPYEKKGPFTRYFDKYYDDLYVGEKSWEKAEIKLVKKSLRILMDKTKLKNKEIELVIGGDLLNQLAATTYGTIGVGNSFIGIYGACSSSALAMTIGANFIESGINNNCVAIVSSHNLSSEKQFRFPTEYGSPKPNSSTTTSTGAASCLISNNIGPIRIESSTLGRIIDYNQKDPFDMGRAMAPAAIDTLYRHLEETKRTPNYYDLILTGDLGKYGKDIMIDYMLNKYSINLHDNYNDCGVLLYDISTQKDIHAGGSGPVCGPLVLYSVIFNKMKKHKLKRVLFLATGALFSPTLLHQHENIYSICHAISLEVV